MAYAHMGHDKQKQRNTHKEMKYVDKPGTLSQDEFTVACTDVQKSMRKYTAHQ